MKRSKMIAKIQIEFPKLRPDLDPKMDADALRSARLEFCGETLGLTRAPKSLTKLTDRDLGRILDAITARQPPEPRESARVDGPRPVTVCNIRQLRPKTAQALSELAIAAEADTSQSEIHRTKSGEVIHLAGNEQTWAIGRLFEYLEWSPQRRRTYISGRWRTSSERTLKPDQATALLYQLLRIAASRDLKLQRGREAIIPAADLAKEIPALKKRLGIGK
jgi:hypothetical protein